MRISFPIALVLLALSAHAEETQNALSADEIIAKYMETQSVETEMAFVEMKTLRSGMEVDERRFLVAYRKNDDASHGYFIRMLHPTEVRGVTVLSNEAASGDVKQYLYLPAIGKARPLSANAKAEPFLGSDFSFEDLNREVPAAHYYERREDAVVQDREVYVLRATEVEENGSAYKHRDLFIDKETSNLLQVDFYGKDEEKIKSLFAFEYDCADMRGETCRPRKAVMANASSGSTTTFTVIESRIDDDIPAELFTPKKLESWQDHEVEQFIFQLGFTVYAEAKIEE